MICVETFLRSDLAHEKKRLLIARGFDARVVVDPLESIAPALSPFQGVGLMVPKARAAEAKAVLREPQKKAS